MTRLPITLTFSHFDLDQGANSSSVFCSSPNANCDVHFSSPSLNSSITAVRGRSQKRGKRRNQSLPPCRRPAPWLWQLPLRPRHQTATVANRRPTLPPSSPRPTGRPASLPSLRRAGASARTPSARPAPAARCPFTCSTRSACATATAGSATGLCTRRTWNCPWTWPACTTSSTWSAPPAPGGRSTTASAPMCRSGGGGGGADGGLHPLRLEAAGGGLHPLRSLCKLEITLLKLIILWQLLEE